MSKAFEIKGFPGYYVTDTGDVYSRNYNHTGRIIKLKQVSNRDGYMRVCLHKDAKQYNKSVHRLVAEAFIPNRDNKSQVNHKNGDKSDNRVENLEWASAKENIQHSYDCLHRKANSCWKGKFGKDNASSKLVIQLKDSVIINEFYGTYEASRKTGINKQLIGDCCRGRQKSAGGYQWKYK